MLALRVWSSRADARLFKQLLQMSSRLKQDFLKGVYISDGSVVSFQKTAVAVLASVVVFLITAVAVLMRLC